MAKLLVDGGRPLRGTVRISGRKNSAVAVMPAALLPQGTSRLENLPRITDVEVFLSILRQMGAEAAWREDGSIEVNAERLYRLPVSFELTRRLRASYYLLGALLARQGRAEVALPGGCDLGPRPIDQHLKGFRALGAEVSLQRGTVKVQARQLRGARIYFDVVSVGATINVLLAATAAEGTTVLENAAREPHVVDLANYLNACGAHIRGAGTDVIKVQGGHPLRAAAHAIIPDEIEAATFMTAAAAAGGDVTLENVIPTHLEPVSAKLKEAGALVLENGDSVRVISTERPLPLQLKTMPYPGFPTDAMPPMTALLSIASGTSLVSEGVWENRFAHVNELRKMGARIRVEGRTAVIEGVDALQAAPVEARDLRAAAALMVAGCIAEGQTEIFGVEHLDRGYEGTEEKLRALGVRVQRLREE